MEDKPTRKTTKEYKQSFINRLGGEEAFVKYNREHALKTYYKKKLEHIDDPKPEPKKRGRPSKQKEPKPPKEPKPRKQRAPREPRSESESEKEREAIKKLKKQIENCELKKALLIILKHI